MVKLSITMGKVFCRKQIQNRNGKISYSEEYQNEDTEDIGMYLGYIKSTFDNL